MPDLVKVTIDGREVMVPKGTLITEAAKQAGVEIPVFCYHEKMHPAGACRMCLVEIEKVPRLQTACTTPVADGMVVRTNTPTVEKARKGVLEFLLCNHPLDCPVCDKGGECPLQDTTFKYGSDRSRYIEEKRHFVKPIRLSQLILLDRERCIMCTRCVRFQREIAGDESLTLLERGACSEVGVAPGRTFDSPFSGNTIELCPVGALTSVKFRFRARSWELTKLPSICSQCSVGCNIKVESRNGEVLRLTSRENADVDDGWLCDRGRFTYEFVNDPHRLTSPMVRKNGSLEPVSWKEAVDTVSQRLRQLKLAAGGERLGGIVSAGATNEEIYLFQKLFRTMLQSNNVDHGLHGDYAFPELGIDACSGSLAGLESAEVVLVAGADVYEQQPVLALRLRKAVLKKGAKLIAVTSKESPLSELGSPWLKVAEGSESAVLNGILGVLLSGGIPRDVAKERLGDLYDIVARYVAEYPLERVRELAGVSEGAVREIAQLLAENSKVAILFSRPQPGAPAGLQEACGRLALATGSLKEPGGGLFPLGMVSNSQGAIDMGGLPKLLPGQRKLSSEQADELEKIWGVRPVENVGLSGLRMIDAAEAGQLSALYLLGVDPLVGDGAERVREALSRLELLVVQDSFLTATAEIAHVVLPSATFAEKDGTFTNLERRVQRLQAAVPIVGDFRQDWETLVAIGNGLGAEWPYSNVGQVFDEIAAVVPMYGGLSFAKLGDKGQRWHYPGVPEPEAAKPENGRIRKLWYKPLEPTTAQDEVQETGA
ncbi:MAG: NADH-quinone oxidoreductase subunit NuoG [Chloroflexota bacterium]